MFPYFIVRLLVSTVNKQEIYLHYADPFRLRPLNFPDTWKVIEMSTQTTRLRGFLVLLATKIHMV